MNGKQVNIAVVGATGVVGREVLGTLQEKGYPPERITALASERSEGSEVEYAEETLEVEKATPDSFRGMGLVLFATPPDVSRTLAPAAQAAGAWVVDVSAAFRMDPQVPLVLPAVNLAVLKAPFRGRIICCPAATTAALVSALEPLRGAFGVKEALVTALLGASSAGARGISELEAQTAGLLSGREHEPSVFPHRLAFNLIPQVGEASAGSPWMGEEEGMQEESRRLWAGASGAPSVIATAVQVPTFYGHALSVAVRLAQPVPVEQARKVLEGSSGVKVLDAPAERVYPMPMVVTADPTVHVGRLRTVPGDSGWLLFFATIDNAGRGAALNLVEVGEALLGRNS